MVCIYKGILLSHKKNKIIPFAATWMDLESFMLNKISHTKTNIIWYCLYVQNCVTLQLKELEKEQTKPKVSKRKNKDQDGNKWSQY